MANQKTDRAYPGTRGQLSAPAGTGVSVQINLRTPTSRPRPESGFARLVYLCSIAFVLVALASAVILLRQGAAKAPSPRMLSQSEIETISKKAQNGDAQAQTALGALYAKGQGVKQDYQQAGGWYRRAAAQGNAAAQLALGELCEAGQGVAQNDAQAADWYTRAAEQGLAAAQYNLAALYAVGKGVKMSNVEALKWYLQAANQGDSLAQYNVGMRYSEGHGVTRDPTLGYKWLSLSAAQGLPDADRALGSLKHTMSADQLSRARELVHSFKPGWRAVP